MIFVTWFKVDRKLSLSVSLCLSCWARQDACLSYRHWDLHKINLLTSLTLISEYKGAPSLSAHNLSLPLSLHTYSQTTLLRSITLYVYPCSSLFPFLPRCLFPPCRCCQLRCTFMGVHKSSNISNKSHHFPIAPTDTCYWPLMSVYLFQCLVSFVFPVSGWLTGQHQASVTQRHVLHYHFFDTPFGTKPFSPWLIFTPYLLENML